MKKMFDLNHPARFFEINGKIKKKKALNYFYRETYDQYLACINRSPKQGMVLEIGGGSGFVKEMIPNIITTDVIAYPGIDYVMDATAFSFADNSLATICMFNVLHHIANTPAFFKEAVRCLQPNGRIFMREPYPGLISLFIFKYLHHENCDIHTRAWEFISQGPLSDANSALPYIIFKRDRERFNHEFPELMLTQFKPHSPLRYWLAGGLQSWSLLPSFLYKLSSLVDNILISISPRLGSFVDIELQRI